MAEEPSTNPYPPFIKLVAGKPTKSKDKRKYGWEIKFTQKDNLKGVVAEIKKINAEMLLGFGTKDEKAEGED